ncbi:MAG TPA: homoserine dehydrogenase [Gammaproteobacteria bacterium]|nr:homoserine dehydrogenase [Gammaproteobacteria bacterium]
MTDVIKIGLLGLGTVGGGTVNVIQRNAAEITRRTGKSLQIVAAAVRDINADRICSTDALELTEDALSIVDNPEIDIVVELMGGTDAAFDLVIRAIGNGKHVVTANKALIAIRGNEIVQAAEQAKVMVAFEAAVAGSIGIIKALREGFSGNQIRSVAGIINGTGNYILTAMGDEHRDFSDVLAEAQALGYAEADPSFDVDGIDAAHKLTIMASLSFGMPLCFDQVFTQGIRDITLADIQMADEFGYRIKHLGIARRTEDGVELRVHPTLVSKEHLLANVNGVMNAVYVDADAAGPSLLYGAGAGADPTASSIVADLVDVARSMGSPATHVPTLGFQASQVEELAVVPQASFRSAYFLRMEVTDQPGVLAEISSIFAALGVSIEAVNQKEPPRGADTASISLITQLTDEAKIINAIGKLEDLSQVASAVNLIRVEQF